MLYVVQVILWGAAEKPQLFADEEKAQVAYVQWARKYWEQRYAAYCDHHGASSDAFASAHAFVKTIDVSEKSKIHFWAFQPEEAGLNAMQQPAQEEFRQAGKEIVAVRDGLAQLLNDLSSLADRFAPMDASPGEAQAAVPEKTSPSLPALPQEEHDSDPQTYTTPEWKKFVGTIKRLGSGSRNEFYLLHRDDWRQDVYSNRTALEYWDWVADRIVKYKDKAKSASYSVVEAPESGGYRFRNREGVASDESFDSEWEAWCAAGLYQEAAGQAEPERP
jgi:hypothetical protein